MKLSLVALAVITGTAYLIGKELKLGQRTDFLDGVFE